MYFKWWTEQEQEQQQQHGVFLMPYVRSKPDQYSTISHCWQGNTSQHNSYLLNMLCCGEESMLLVCRSKPRLGGAHSLGASSTSWAEVGQTGWTQGLWCRQQGFSSAMATAISLSSDDPVAQIHPATNPACHIGMAHLQQKQRDKQCTVGLLDCKERRQRQTIPQAQWW